MNTQAITRLNISPDAQAILMTLLNENVQLKQQLAQQESELKDELLPTIDAMKLLGCGRKKFWELAKKDGFPPAIPFGRSNHYRRAQLIKFRDSYIESKEA
ncbi:hypothetical protein EXT48_08320 [Pseudoalteromonas sp. CO348]|uniref:helix-turn-helix transcriptional regulator n=1 Tax=Pseudoalteromonas sp. CO348 TaxID=1777271 RepID=UPI0010238423|nr:hypothetical protein [Pseudoalteromonas sp. CO348]RZG05529.1 hypothetical protein EXT48_08320 [Pseudoalteromonas sp. CO348]